MPKLSHTALLVTGLMTALAASRCQAQNWLTGDFDDPWDFSDQVLGEDADADIGGGGRSGAIPTGPPVCSTRIRTASTITKAGFTSRKLRTAAKAWTSAAAST